MIYRLYVTVCSDSGEVSAPMVLDLDQSDFVPPLFNLSEARTLAASLYGGGKTAHPLFEIGSFNTETGDLTTVAGVRDMFDAHEALADAPWQSAGAPVLPRVGRIKRNKMH